MTNQKHKNTLKGYRILNPVRVVIKLPRGWKAQRLLYHEVMNRLAEEIHHKTDNDVLVSELVREIKEKIRLAGKKHYKDMDVFNEDPFSFVARVAEDAGLCVVKGRYFYAGKSVIGTGKDKVTRRWGKTWDVHSAILEQQAYESWRAIDILTGNQRKQGIPSGWSEFFYDRSKAIEELIEGEEREANKTEKKEE